jgi:flagellar capping protein FliD
MMVGDPDGSSPLIVRSRTNAFDDVIPDLTVTALRAADTPVQVTSRTDDDKVIETVTEFVERYNELVDGIAELTRYDAETEEAGLLLGDSTLRGVLTQLSAAVSRYVVGSPANLNLAAHVGLRTGTGGRLVLDAATLAEKLATSRDRVEALFTSERRLEETTLLADFRNGEGVRTAPGQPDFEIYARDGTSFAVDLGSARTVRDVLNAINDAAGNDSVTASLSRDGRSFELTDGSTGSSAFRVAALNGSAARNDLGIDAAARGGAITGSAIDLTGDWGLGRRLVDALERMVAVDTGSVQLRADGMGERIEDLKERAEALEERLERQEELLRRQFAQLEVIMGQQQNTLQRLNAIMGSLRRGGE